MDPFEQMLKDIERVERLARQSGGQLLPWFETKTTLASDDEQALSHARLREGNPSDEDLEELVRMKIKEFLGKLGNQGNPS